MIESSPASQAKIISLTRMIRGHVINRDHTIAIFKRERSHFDTILNGLEEAILAYNTHTSSTLPDELQVSAQLNEALGLQKLPTISELLEKCKNHDPINGFSLHQKAIANLNALIEGGKLSYPDNVSDPFSYGVATAIHWYEEIVQLMFPKSPHMRLDLVGDALSETLLYRRYIRNDGSAVTEPLEDTLINSLGWVRGYDRFHPGLLRAVPPAG